RQYDYPFLKSFAEVREAGRAFGASHPNYLEHQIEAGTPDDLALLCYTSGTTGNPKGVMLSHRNLIDAAKTFAASEDIRQTDEWLCYLPMAWVGDSLYSTVMSLLVGFSCSCPESPETVQRDLRAPLGADAFRFFRSVGINLKQIYGATEMCGLAALQPDGEADPNTVGRLCPGVSVRIEESGEVLVRSPAIFQGYYKQPEATRDTIIDGWLRTGDAGFVDPRGHLVIIDRAKDVGKLSDGSPFAPQFLENKLKYSPFINEAV